MSNLYTLADKPPKVSRNDLPARVAAWIVAYLFPKDFVLTGNVPEPSIAVLEAMKGRLRADIARAVWEEEIALEGEMALQGKERTKPGPLSASSPP